MSARRNSPGLSNEYLMRLPPPGRASSAKPAKSCRPHKSLVEAQRVLSAQQGGASIAIPDLLKLGDALKKTGKTIWGRMHAAIFGCPAQPPAMPPVPAPAVGGMPRKFGGGPDSFAYPLARKLPR